MRLVPSERPRRGRRRKLIALRYLYSVVLTRNFDKTNPIFLLFLSLQ